MPVRFYPWWKQDQLSPHVISGTVPAVPPKPHCSLYHMTGKLRSLQTKVGEPAQWQNHRASPRPGDVALQELSDRLGAHHQGLLPFESAVREVYKKGGVTKHQFLCLFNMNALWQNRLFEFEVLLSESIWAGQLINNRNLFLPGLKAESSRSGPSSACLLLTVSLQGRKGPGSTVGSLSQEY